MPTTTGRATDFITFSRASNATVVASDGKIKWAGHNLLAQSEQFDGSDWVVGDATISANAATAPNGTTTADFLRETATTAQHYVYRNVSVSAAEHKFSFYAKGVGRDWAYAAFTTTGSCYFGLTGSGSVGTASGCTGSITALSDGWYLCTVTMTHAAGTVGTIIYPASANGTSSYAGDITKGLYLWGAHLYRSDLGGMVANPARGDSYYPTTSAAYYAPRLDYDPVTLGAKGLLVEQQSTNLCLRSEEFDNASWTKTNLTVSANSAVAPSGAMTADTLTATAGNATIMQGVTTTAVAFTFSIYIKRKTGTGNIDITMDGTTWVRQTISSFRWTRCIVTQTGVAGTSNPGIRIVTSGNEVYAWGAQAE